MSSDEDLSRPLPLGQWVSWFLEKFAAPDLDPACVRSYLFHFADLGVLKPFDSGLWELTGVDSDVPPDRIENDLRVRLETLSQTEQGFALACFLGRPPGKLPGPVADSSRPSRPGKKDRAASAGGPSGYPPIQRASDLSNLQIVKKVGRQLSPFLEMEKNMLARLQGPHTAKEDAQRIFNYVLGKTRKKAEPKKWEQLSRKRHR